MNRFSASNRERAASPSAASLRTSSGLRTRARAVAALVALSLLGSSCEDPVTLTPAPEPPPGSPEALVTALSKAYQQRSPELFSSLLANEHSANADYFFFLSEPTDTGEDKWGRTEEVRIHQRMLRPDQLPPGDAAVNAELWPRSISITLTPMEEFQERRADLYSANAGADGKLNPQRWRALDARYSTYVLWDLAGVDYKVEGEANFVIIEDLDKQPGEAGKFLLYIWEDIWPPFLSLGDRISSAATWSMIKSLYR